MPLPFFMRLGRLHRGKAGYDKFASQVGGMHIYASIDNQFVWYYKINSDVKIDIIYLPTSAFIMSGGEMYRSDIRWLWKILSGFDPKWHVRAGTHGGTSLTVTNSLLYYKPSATEPIIADPDCDMLLMWRWIQYILSVSLMKQKSGKERLLLNQPSVVPTSTSLYTVSELLCKS